MNGTNDGKAKTRKDLLARMRKTPPHEQKPADVSREMEIPTDEWIELTNENEK